MRKDLEFENGLGPSLPLSYRQYPGVTYVKQAVARYRAESSEELVANPKKLLAMVRHHKENQVPRLETLEDYYLGNNLSILSGKRRLESQKADNRVRHSFGATISDFINTYVLGNPVKILANSDQAKGFEELLTEFNDSNDINAHNSEIGRDQNNFGRAYELLERTTDDEDKIYRLDPTEVFMIYDYTVRSRVIGACRYYLVDQNKDTYTVELYTHEAIYRYGQVPLYGGDKIELAEEPEPHLFGGVPIVEYRSDRYRLGAYERVIPLIDAYDSVTSDLANYMTDYNDAILVIEGSLKKEVAKKLPEMRDANIIVLDPSEDAQGNPVAVSARYLTKSYDVAGAEAYKTRLKNDIFELSGVPNLSDEAFSGTRSGEALKYKLFGLEQRRMDKEQFFAKGLRVRYKLLENLKRAVSEFSGPPVTLDFTFTPNAPKAYLDELTTYTNAGGELSEETMLSLLSFVDDVSAEMERLKEERGPSRLSLDDMIHAKKHDRAREADAGVRAEEGASKTQENPEG